MKKIFIWILIMMFLQVSLTGCHSEEMKAAVAEYETLRNRVEEMNTELDLVISEAESLILENNPALDMSLIPVLETAISEGKSEKEEIPERPKKLDEILAVNENMKSIDYSEVIKYIQDKKLDLEISIKKYALVNAPKEQYVIDCLSKIENITGISAVTEENDPNGNLNKVGGYSSHVYFESALIDQNSIYGDSIIEKGTDCGGSIEVYTCEEDAIERNEYLSAFDGGIFASGSHTVIGTVIVRTSNELTASQQKALEAEIIDVLTKIE